MLSIPSVRSGKEEGRTRDERVAAAARQARIERTRRIMRPRMLTVAVVERRSGNAGESRDVRRQALRRLRAEILADARAREDTPARRVTCERIPREVPAAATDLGSPRVPLSCVAITSELGANERTTGITVGYPYRALVDFGSGRVGYCRTIVQAGEGSFTGRPEVAIPTACGG